MLHTELPKDVSSEVIAIDVLQRATKFWLAHNALPDKHIETFSNLTPLRK